MNHKSILEIPEVKDSEIVWNLKSANDYDVFYEIGLLRNGSAFFSYMPNNNKNLADLYSKILSLTDNEWLYRGFLESAKIKINNILEITSSGKASKILSHVPPELEIIRKDWGWFNYGFGIEEGGFISRIYGITTSGLALQIFEPLILKNLIRMGYHILVLLKDDPQAINFLDSFMKLETVIETRCHII